MIKNFVIAIFILCLSCLCFASEQMSKVDKLVLDIEQTTKNIKDMQFDYTQNVSYSLADETQEYTGTIKYKDKNHIYMFQEGPQKHYTYVNGNKITNYIPENKQAIIESWSNVLNNDVIVMTILEFTGDLKNFKKKNTIELESETNTAYKLNISSKKAKSNWKIKLEIDKETMLIEKAVYATNNYTINVLLKNYKLNNNFNKNTFKFIAPEDVEVIEF